MNRRQAILTLAAIGLMRPRAGRAAGLPIPGDALAGCVNSWRADLTPVRWAPELAPGCEAWARHLAEAGMYRPDGSFRHSLPWLGQECIAAHQEDWSEAFRAWTGSPAHLEVLRAPDARRVAMGGYSDHRGLFWVLRVTEET